jgi:prolyl oligopeptidase
VFDDFIAAAAAARYLIRSALHHPRAPRRHRGQQRRVADGRFLHPASRAVARRGLPGRHLRHAAGRDPNGAFNTTEFGSVKDADQFQALYSHSPYHHVVAGTRYPAIFMATGENDGRVNPMHSRKMIARLQAATASRRPVCLSINSLGHGIGSALSIRVNQSADYIASCSTSSG